MSVLCSCCYLLPGVLARPVVVVVVIVVVVFSFFVAV